MNENRLLCSILHNINMNPSGMHKSTMMCSTYNLKEPYSYIEAIAVSIIKIHNNEEDYISEMKRKKDAFKTSEDRVAFLYSGSYVSKSAYNKFSYPHNEESVSDFVETVINNSPK